MDPLGLGYNFISGMQLYGCKFIAACLMAQKIGRSNCIMLLIMILIKSIIQSFVVLLPSPENMT